MMKKVALISSVLVSFLSLFTLIPWLNMIDAPVNAATPLTAVSSAHTEITATTAQGLTFTLLTPPATTSAAGRLDIAGLEQRIQESGAPDLPVYATYIALPPQAEAVVSVVATQVTETATPPLRPVATFAVSLPAGSHDFFDTQAATAVREQLNQPLYQPDSTLYAQNTPYPNTLYTLSKPMYYRDLRLVKLTLHPVRYNPVVGLLSQAGQLQVSVSFIGGDVSQGYAGNGRDHRELSPPILNYHQAQNWRHLPPNLLETTVTTLPVGQQTFKITINQDGIYEITGANLQTSGMNIASVNPSTLQMLHRGDPVAFQLIDDGDSVLDPTDKIRFYGWAFDGPRAEKQYLGDQNVYWLWANGHSTHVVTATNEVGQDYPLITTFPESITRDNPTTPEQTYYHYHTQTNLWELFPNEPDAWYMDWIVKSGSALITRTYPITLPHPAPTGPNAQVLVEITTFNNLLNYVGRVTLNNFPEFSGQKTLPRYWNDNITTTVPITTLQHMVNQVHYASLTNATLQEIVYINRATVDYTRQLVALNDELQFSMPTAGSHEFHVTDFNSNQAIVWDISNRLTPVALEMNGAISGTAPFTYQIGRTHGENAAFIATTAANLRQPTQITAYTPPSLNPAGGGAQWVAISHANFLTAAEELATHRADPTFTALSTHVVDIADVINQYGYGLAIPEAIHNYLAYAYGNWSIQPEYVLLLGDATYNPLNLNCFIHTRSCRPGFDAQEPNLLLTNLIFEDPYQGLIPSDHPFVTISGDDLIPDIAIGRIAASTLEEAENVISKIILYEQTQIDPAGWEQHSDIVFVADNADDGGDFCAENEIVANSIPSNFDMEHLCIIDPATDTENIRIAMREAITNGISLLNYRGHGSPWTWAGSPTLLDVRNDSYLVTWDNVNKPVVILSADCLDGYFTYAGIPGLGETILKMGLNRGTAAHWSSTGLGTTFEHTALMLSFYEGLFAQGHTAIGDAINYAKLLYFLGGYQQAELYSFTLQGDPAMQLFRPDLSLEISARPRSVTPGEVITFNLEIQNQALYPTFPTLTSTLPAGLEFGGVTATASISENVDADTGLIIVDVVSSVPENEAVTVTITATVSGNAVAGSVIFQSAVDSPGLDLNLENNEDQATVTIFIEIKRVFLPAILRN